MKRGAAMRYIIMLLCAALLSCEGPVGPQGPRGYPGETTGVETITGTLQFSSEYIEYWTLTFSPEPNTIIVSVQVGALQNQYFNLYEPRWEYSIAEETGKFTVYIFSTNPTVESGMAYVIITAEAT